MYCAFFLAIINIMSGTAVFDENLQQQTVPSKSWKLEMEMEKVKGGDASSGDAV